MISRRGSRDRKVGKQFVARSVRDTAKRLGTLN